MLSSALYLRARQPGNASHAVAQPAIPEAVEIMRSEGGPESVLQYKL